MIIYKYSTAFKLMGTCVGLLDDYNIMEEFESKRVCEFCNSQEGKLRKIGNFIVELSEVKIEDDVKLT